MTFFEEEASKQRDEHQSLVKELEKGRALSTRLTEVSSQQVARLKEAKAHLKEMDFENSRLKIELAEANRRLQEVEEGIARRVEAAISDFKKSEDFKKEAVAFARAEFSKTLLDVARHLLQNGVDRAIVAGSHPSFMKLAHPKAPEFVPPH